MPRTPYSAKTLIAQVQLLRKKVTADLSEPDGLDVYRALSFDKATSKWLAPILWELDDPRIVEWIYEDGVATVTFSPKRNADDPQPFALDAAIMVAESRLESVVVDGQGNPAAPSDGQK